MSGRLVGTGCVLWALACLWLGGVRSAQAAAPGWQLRWWHTEQGCPGDVISSLVQGRDGFLWCGTDYALARFDGSRFCAVRVPGGNLRNYRGFDAGGEGLWVVSRTGALLRWDGRDMTEWWSAVPALTNVMAVGEFSGGRPVVIGNRGQVWSGDPGAPEERVPPLARPVRAVVAPQGGMPGWLLEGNGGLSRLTEGGRESVPLPATGLCVVVSSSVWVGVGHADGVLGHGPDGWVSEKVPAGMGPVTDLVRAPHGALWARGGGQTWRRAPSGVWEGPFGVWPASPPPRDGVVPVLTAVDTAGALWRCGAGGEVVRTDVRGIVTTILAAGELPAYVSALTTDREGNVWVGVYRTGLLRLRAQRFEAFRVGLELPAPVWTLAEDDEGSIWTNPEFQPVHRLVPGGSRFEPVPGLPEWPYVLARDPEGRVLAGTPHFNSLHRFEGGRFQQVSYLPDTHAYPYALHMEPSGRIWVGNAAGIRRGLTNVWESLMPRERARVIVPDAAGQLWLGLNEGRLARRETNGFRVWGRPEGLDAGDITSLLPMDNGDLWLGSLSGLWLMREGRFHRFGREHGLPDDCAAQVLTDSQHSLWVGTRGGLCRVWLASVDRVLSGASDRLDAVVFDESDGLPSRTFAHRNGISALRAADGVLWWVTMRGLARCRPEAFPVNTVPVRPRLEEILVDGRPHAAEVPSTNRAAWAELSLAAVKQLTLTPGRHVVRLQFSAPCLSGAEKVRVQCRLTGQDAGWRQLGPDQRVEYHFVTPGENQLEVRAGNDDGLWSEAERALAITVEPRFVETPAFAWLLAGTVAAGLAGGGMVLQQARVRRRLARLELARSREAERTRIARDLHDELGARLTEISVLAQSARRELPPGDGPATRLASLTTKVNDLVTVVDEIVWAVDPTKDSLPALVRYVSGWVQEMAGNAGLECSLTVEGDVPEVPLDAETRHHLLLAVREAVTNAVRHAQARRLSLAVACPPGGLVITVADDGIGFDTASDRNGNGQHNLRDRLKAMHGSAEVMSGAGHGTRVVFTLPVPGTGPDVGK